MGKKMFAGAGKEEILLKEEYLVIEEFAIVHRALDVRAIMIESQKKFAFISIEMTSLPEKEIEEIKNRIVEVVPLEKENIWVSCTHTFSAPHLLPDFILMEQEKIEKKSEYRRAIQDAAVAAIQKARDRMTKITLRFGTAFCEINTARDVELEDGWWIGETGKGLVNHEVQTLRLDNEDGKPIAVIFNYAIQSSVLDGSTLSAGGKAVSPDIAGTACDYVERKYRKPNAVALFLLGAAGDQVPVKKSISETFVNGERVRKDRHEEGFKICEKLGMSLGEAVYASAEKSKPIPGICPISIDRKQIKVPAKEMQRNLKDLRPVKEFTYVSAGDSITEVEVVTLGDLAIVGVKPELNCITATAIKACSPYKNTWIATMVNGASKYMADKSSYDRFTYEAQNSPFGKGAAEILMKESIQMLNEMKEKEVQTQETGSYLLHTYTDSMGRTLNYNLFIPENYDSKKSYPLVLFIHDAGICSKSDTEIMQENGAKIWTLKEEQQKRPCFVVVPHYPNKCAEDDFTVGWEANTTIDLVQSLRKEYSINRNRIYGTGQSMGCMILCELNIRYPDFFGGCYLVAGQWNPNTMAAAKHANLWALVSEKDMKAFPIMGACMESIEKTGTRVCRGSWNGRSPEGEQNQAVKAIIKKDCSTYFTWLEGESVLEEGETASNPGEYHMKTWKRAYNIEAIREWLFEQYRTIDFSGKHDVLISNEDGTIQPMDQPFFEAKKVADGTWQILSDGDYSYLVEGGEQAIVIDSGYGCGNIREFCQTLTDKPVKNIANTHHHFDHTANNGYFECAYMSAATAPLATIPFPSFEGVRFPRDYEVVIVKDGDVINLGGNRSLEVFEIPDHAVGSIAFLDKREKLLFCGDEMCMPMGKPLTGSVERFKRYLDKLMTRRSDIEQLMGGPGICDASLMDQLLENMNYILEGHEGELEGKFEGPKGPGAKQPCTDGVPEGVTVYNRRLPHWPEDMPAHMGQPDPDRRIMNYAGTTVMYNVKKVRE